MKAQSSTSSKILHLLSKKKKRKEKEEEEEKRNYGKQSRLCVGLYLENAWKDTHQTVHSISLGHEFKRGG